jgi:SAM-dependent methyltransferase
MNINIDIYNQVYNTIQKILKNSNNIDSDNIEFEAVINSRSIDKDQFRRVFNYLQNDTENYKNITEIDNETLDITSPIKKFFRLSIKGKQKIINYCRDNKTKNKIDDAIIKRKIQDYKSINIDDYNVRFNLKSEIPIEDDKYENICHIFDNNIKDFRFKKRYSFETIDKLFRVDLTIVKSSKLSKINFIESGVTTNIENFEIEIEFIKPNNVLFNEQHYDSYTKKYFAILAQILSEIHNTNLLMSNIEYENVKKDYLELIKRKKNPSNMNKEFFGPQPVALELQNLLENPSYNVPSIINNYTVTDKADGERMLLYVNENKNIYLINNRLKIFNTGLQNDNINTLIDGEYITADINNQSIKLYMCFDIYFNNNVDVTNYPLLNYIGNKKGEDNRISFLNKFEKTIKIDSKSSEIQKNLKIKVKEFYSTDIDSIFNLSKKILDKKNNNKLNYHIDGLIYTPANLGVGAYTTDTDKSEYFGTWNMVMKWKPPEENSIDFLININDTVLVIDSNNYKLCKLFVGHNKFEEIDPIKILADENLSNDIKYEPYEFAECLLPLDINNNIHTIITDEILLDNIIVEFSYNNADKLIDETLRWKPLRIRYDKTELTNINKTIAANNINTANKTMNTILNPIPLNVIIGIEKLDKDIEFIDSDVYYNNEGINRNNSITFNMLNFHNSTIKNKYLYAKFRNIADKSLFEIACGKGGDMHRWFYHKYTPVVGIDISLDNIMNEKNGIYSRYKNNKKNYSNSNSSMIFFKMDASQIWDENYISTIDHPISKDFAQILWGIREPSKKYFKQFYRMSTNQKFNLISCQFAIHYFFENEQILDNLINNIDSILKPGGYFFGSCLDGYLVDTELNKSKDGIINGIKDDKYLIWQIKKQYHTPFDKIQPFNNFGKKIDVFVETINKEFSEFLVDFNLLKIKLENKNIRLLDSNNLKKLKITSESSTELFSEIYKYELSKNNLKQNEIMTNPDLKNYSFLNRIWIFQKI